MATTPTRNMMNQVKKLIMPLSFELHKGQAGRVGVVGGSKDYTGAPYFSAYSAMLLGADLGHVICEPTADLIVHRIINPERPFQDFETELEGLISRLHTLVIGPGLGREKYMQDAAKYSIKLARKRNMYLVLDADALYLVQNDPEVIKGYPRAVLTPNVVEFKRLCESLDIDTNNNSESLASLVSQKLGNVTIIQKGAVDIIARNSLVEKVNIQGGLKRCGGQGDLLSGMLGTFLCWAMTYEEAPFGSNSEKDRIPKDELTIVAAYGAAVTTRTASKLAFEENKRSTQSSDLLRHVGAAYEALWQNQHYYQSQSQQGPDSKI